MPQDQDQRLELLTQSEQLSHAIKHLRKRKRDPKETSTMLDEAGRLHKIILEKANKMSQGIGRFAQQVLHARVRMDLNSGDASAKMQEMQSLAAKMVLLATEAEKAHNAAVAGGQTAAGVATQLLPAGAVDSEKPEA